MKTTAIVLISALLGAGATYMLDTSSRSELRQEGPSQRDLDYMEVALEGAQERAQEYQQRVERLTEKVDRLEIEADLADPGLTPTDAPLADGRHAVFLDGLDDNSLVFDVIQWLSGDEANAAALEDGAIEEGDVVPNDYYIRNQNPQLRTRAVTADVDVVLSTWDCRNIPDEKPVVFARFVELFNSPGRCAQNLLHNPYWLTIENGVIVAIEEQYRP